MTDQLGYWYQLEWDFLDKLLSIDGIKPSDKLSEGSEKIEIHRDDSYSIKASIFGKLKSFKNDVFR